jgi:hypothetical protein
MREQLYEFAQCTLQVLHVSTVRHAAHIRRCVTAPVYIMASPEHEAFCVLQLAKRNSIVHIYFSHDFSLQLLHLSVHASTNPTLLQFGFL